jgi:mRNA interferase MazF
MWRARNASDLVPETADRFRAPLVPGLVPTRLHQSSKAQAEQMRSVVVERIGRRVGLVRAELLMALDEALRLHLAL